MKWRLEGEPYPQGVSFTSTNYMYEGKRRQSLEIGLRYLKWAFSIRFKSWDKTNLRIGYETGEVIDWLPGQRPLHKIVDFSF